MKLKYRIIILIIIFSFSLLSYFFIILNNNEISNEKEYLKKLINNLIMEQMELNRLDHLSFTEQLEKYKKAENTTNSVFEKIKKIEYMKNNPDIKVALDIILKLQIQKTKRNNNFYKITNKILHYIDVVYNYYNIFDVNLNRLYNEAIKTLSKSDKTLFIQDYNDILIHLILLDNTILESIEILDNQISIIESIINTNYLSGQAVALIVIFLSLFSIFIISYIDRKEKNKLQVLLKNIINSMNSIFISIDDNGKIIQWNLEAGKFTGVPESKGIGKNFLILFPFFTSEKFKTIKKTIKEKKIYKEEKHKLYAQDGEFNYYDISIFPLLGGLMTGAVIRIDNVTEKTMLQESIIQSEKMASIGKFAAGMTHEINNPITGIIQNTQVVISRLFNT